MFYNLLSKLEQRNCVCFVYHLLFLVECNCMEENKPIRQKQSVINCVDNVNWPP